MPTFSFPSTTTEQMAETPKPKNKRSKKEKIVATKDAETNEQTTEATEAAEATLEAEEATVEAEAKEKEKTVVSNGAQASTPQREKGSQYDPPAPQGPEAPPLLLPHQALSLAQLLTITGASGEGASAEAEALLRECGWELERALLSKLQPASEARHSSSGSSGSSTSTSTTTTTATASAFLFANNARVSSGSSRSIGGSGSSLSPQLPPEKPRASKPARSEPMRSIDFITKA